jgi:hypothetical protein
MAKIRILYQPDEQVVLLHPALKNRRLGESEEQHLKRYYKEIISKFPKYKDLPFEDKHVDDLPKEDREKWRGSKGNGVRIDESIKTVQEKRKVVEDALDAELAKPDGDPMKALRLQRKLNKTSLGVAEEPNEGRNA